MFEQINSVIFDMDGVLVDSEEVIEAAAIKGLSEFGVSAKHEDFIPFVGAGENRYVGGVAEKYGVPFSLEMKARVYEIYVEMVPEKLKVYDGIVQLLSDLKARSFKLALASSADQIKVDANLKAAGINKEIFSSIVCGEDVILKKPFPDVFLKAASMMGSIPADCVVVEDAINGIRAAKAAGMSCYSNYIFI